MKTNSATKPRTAHTVAKHRTQSCKMPRPGQKCPHCGIGKLDYDGLLNLVCSTCGHPAISGGFT